MKLILNDTEVSNSLCKKLLLTSSSAMTEKKRNACFNSIHKTVAFVKNFRVNVSALLLGRWKPY